MMEAVVEVDCYPHEVAPPSRLAGPDGFGGVRVSPEGDGDPQLERFSSFLGQRRDAVGAVDLPTVADLTSDVRQRSCFSSEELSKQLPCNCTNGPSCTPKVEEVQLHRRSGKIAGSKSGCTKRSRILEAEDATLMVEVDAKDVSEKLESFETKCGSQHEKSQLAKPKNSFSSKRGDRKNLKTCMKSKFDYFSMKAGLLGCSSAAGGNNFFELYGLKTELQDITKLVDDISLNDLLEDTYVFPTTIRSDKGKKAANGAEDIIHSVRRACDILQLPKTVKSENLADTDSYSHEKTVSCPDSLSILANGDPSATASHSSDHDQDSCVKPESPINLLDFPFEQPLVTLERLALTPPKDFESLLHDAAKPAMPYRNASDPRLAKQLCRGASLPPFSWSHAFNGHSKSNSDAVKLLTSRNSCEGRWIRLGNFVDCPMTPLNVELDSLTYDESLVPVRGPKLSFVENKMSNSKPVPSFERSSSVVMGLAASSLASQDFQASGSSMKCQGKVEYCPRIFAAAQTLCDIATNAMKIDQDGIIRWPKKLSTKAMKARKSKSDEKLDEVLARSTSCMVSNNMARNGVEHKVFSKRPRLLSQSNGVIGSLSWSAPKSIRSSPNKSDKDLIAESRDSAIYTVKQSPVMPPPPAKVVSRHGDGQKKIRKFMQMDWKRGQ